LSGGSRYFELLDIIEVGGHKGLAVYFIADCNKIGSHLRFIF